MPDVHLPVQRIPDSAVMARELASLIEGDVRFDGHDRHLYSTDASLYQVMPIGVVVPRSIDDVQRTIEFCSERGIAMLPRGAGTSLAGQTVNVAVVIDFSAHCNHVIEIDAAGRRASVQPGVVLESLNQALRPHGLMFGPDVATASHATLGGMIGNNSSGAHSVLYGRTVEHLPSIDVVLADGARLTLNEGESSRDKRVCALTRDVAGIVKPLASEIRSRYPRTTRRVNGYNLDLILDQLESSSGEQFDRVNLAHLICGSEGTLATVLEAEVNLVDRPRETGLAIVAFESVDQALRAVSPILSTQPAAIELLDSIVIDAAGNNSKYARLAGSLPQPQGRRPAAVLYVEYFAGNEDELDDRFEALKHVAMPNAVQRYDDQETISDVWALRKAGEALLCAMPGERKPLTFIEDMAVEPGDLPQFIARFDELLRNHGTSAAYYAHASVGCLHIRPLINVYDDKDLQRMQRIAEDATSLVMELDGALSGEHGDGRVRSHLLRQFYGDAICDAFAKLKALFDPRGLLNPGNIVEPAGMTDHLRVRPDNAHVRALPAKTYYSYEREEELHGAVTLCNGAGFCRRIDSGVMCPSFRATNDERHATRGRGNALRLAITGQLGTSDDDVWNNADVLETLDLCLSCKACKTECPSNVDIAKLKAEYVAQHYDVIGGVPFRARVIGDIRAVNRLGSQFHPVANALMRAPGVSHMMKRALGVHPRRSLPRLSRSLFRRTAKTTPANVEGPTVILFADCFTAYNEPDIGEAAIRTLEALGYHVHVSDAGCCGRAQISNGLLNAAQSTCASTIRNLGREMDEHDPSAIVCCEPSCVSAMIDDWSDLHVRVDPAVRDRVVESAMSIETFIECEEREHPTSINFSDVSHPEPVLVHGHCHQKALWSTRAMASMCRDVVGADVSMIDSTCCGMAGAFGYSSDHFDISMRIGELDLFPAIRSAPDAVILAPGTSCRHQIRDGTGRNALHPIVWFAQHIEEAMNSERVIR